MAAPGAGDEQTAPAQINRFNAASSVSRGAPFVHSAVPLLGDEDTSRPAEIPDAGCSSGGGGGGGSGSGYSSPPLYS
jgi:hypothetical protein